MGIGESSECSMALMAKLSGLMTTERDGFGDVGWTRSDQSLTPISTNLYSPLTLLNMNVASPQEIAK